MNTKRDIDRLTETLECFRDSVPLMIGSYSASCWRLAATLIERCFDAILADGLAFHQAGVPSGTARCFAPSAKAKLAAAAADRS